MSEYQKQGYLTDQFRIFHISDRTRKTFSFHYHDFDKILIFLGGDVNYMIEGKCYTLEPYDIVFVRHNEIHRPVIKSDLPYERIIIYISPGFLDAYRTDAYDLSGCFDTSSAAASSVLRSPSVRQSPLFQSIRRLEQSFPDKDYAASLYQQVLFLEFMIQLNRAARHDALRFPDTAQAHPKIQEIVGYINSHLTGELTVDHLAGKFYMSRYHMMRTFKAETGYTIGNYITLKRLALAKERILQQEPITQVCFDCGFRDYSAFLRAYKKNFHESPRETLARL